MRGKQNKKQKSWMILLHTEVYLFFCCLLFVYFLTCVCITDTFINIKFLIIF